MAELEKEQAQGANLPIALAVGLVAALVSGAVWAMIAVAANLEVGYVAVGVGWLVGTGVVLGAGGKKGRPLQYVAVGCAVLGLLLGKYFTVAHVVKEYAGQQLEKFEADYANRSTQVTGQEKEDLDKQAEILKGKLREMRDLSYFSPTMMGMFAEGLGSTFGFFDLLWLLLALGIAWRKPMPTPVRVR